MDTRLFGEWAMSMSLYIFAVAEGRNTFLYYRKCPMYVTVRVGVMVANERL